MQLVQSSPTQTWLLYRLVCQQTRQSWAKTEEVVAAQGLLEDQEAAMKSRQNQHSHYPRCSYHRQHPKSPHCHLRNQRPAWPSSAVSMAEAPPCTESVAAVVEACRRTKSAARRSTAQ
eukprot:3058781-Pleurochrysis_carterae.AAC.2